MQSVSSRIWTRVAVSISYHEHLLCLYHQYFREIQIYAYKDTYIVIQ